MTEHIRFFVPGVPVPKQSFRYSGRGGGYTDPRVTAWQEQVGYAARQNIIEPITGNVSLTLKFYLRDNHRVDADNLSKAVCDALNGIAYKDDRQITDLRITKAIYRNNPGVWIELSQKESEK